MLMMLGDVDCGGVDSALRVHFSRPNIIRRLHFTLERALNVQLRSIPCVWNDGMMIP